MKYSILFLMLIVVSSFSLVQAETFGYGRTESTPINYSTIPTGDNSSWNESHARTIFYDAESDLTGLLDDNYAGIEWDYNQTLATYNAWNSVWLSTYNSTYAAKANYQFEDNNFNGSGNFTGDYLFGNLSWNYLYDYPIACPAGSSITQLGDSVVCSSFAQENTNVTFQNITANTLTVGTDALVVNAVGYEGRVGIGTTSPNQKLQVDGSINISGTTYVDTINSSSSGNVTITSAGGSVIIKLG